MLARGEGSTPGSRDHSNASAIDGGQGMRLVGMRVMSGDAIVSIAETIDGLSYGTDPDGYTSFLFATDDADKAREMASEDFSCALTVRAILAKAEVDGMCELAGREQDVLREPYAGLTGLAVALLIQLAQARGLWLSHPTMDDLQPGVVVLIDAPDHALTIVGRTEQGGAVILETIEGGMIDPPNHGKGTAIHRKIRYAERGPFGRLIVGRTVRGIFDAGALPCLTDGP